MTVAVNTWEQLQLGLRLAEPGRLELTTVSNAVGADAHFDALTIEHTGSPIVQEQHSYAYGAPLTGLNYVVGTKRYRHGYQGQFAEKDEETGWDSFELRLYDSRIGRWTSYDPYGQFHSPYVGMGNNPVSSVDPNGGFADPIIRIVGNGLLHESFKIMINLAAIGTALKAAAPVVLRAGINAGLGAGRYQGLRAQEDPRGGRIFADEQAAYRNMVNTQKNGRESMAWLLQNVTTKRNVVLVEGSTHKTEHTAMPDYTVRDGLIGRLEGGKVVVYRVIANVHTHPRHPNQSINAYEGPSGPGNSWTGGDGDMGFYEYIGRRSMYIIGPTQVSKLNPNLPTKNIGGVNPHRIFSTKELLYGDINKFSLFKAR